MTENNPLQQPTVLSWSTLTLLPTKSPAIFWKPTESQHHTYVVIIPEQHYEMSFIITIKWGNYHKVVKPQSQVFCLIWVSSSVSSQILSLFYFLQQIALSSLVRLLCTQSWWHILFSISVSFPCSKCIWVPRHVPSHLLPKLILGNAICIQDTWRHIVEAELWVDLTHWVGSP